MPKRPSLPRPRLGRPHLPSPLPPSLWSDGARRVAAGLALLAVAAIGFGVGYLVFDGSGGDSEAPAPTAVVVEEPSEHESGSSIAFPELATVNTTRIGGEDSAANAAGVALTVFPTVGGVGATQAVVLVPDDSWQAALAATPLVADPVGAPVLISGTDEIPAVTSDALAALAPQGLAAADGTQAFAIGGATAPEGLETVELDGTTPADIAEQVDAQRTKIDATREAAHLLVVSSEKPGLAMPGAAWAAASGDPLLFAAGDEIPDGTLEVVRRNRKVPIYVLGPESAISAKAVKELGKVGGEVTRVGAEDAVENAIELARFVDGDFGWNINDPGHGMAIANVAQPLDAAAAAPLAAAGTPGPLLVTDDAATVPEPLRGFLADTQPGYEDDPTRAVYNHIWLIGDPKTISVPFQAQVDQLTKLTPVSGSTEIPDLGVTTPDEPEAPSDAEESDGSSADGQDDAGSTTDGGDRRNEGSDGGSGP